MEVVLQLISELMVRVELGVMELTVLLLLLLEFLLLTEVVVEVEVIA